MAEQSQPQTGSEKIEKSKKDARVTQSFVARFSIVTPIATVAPGESVELTREDYDALAELGAIDGVWAE